MGQDGAERSPHILIIPHPSVPHITPLVHLAEHLVHQGKVECTILSYDFLLEKVAKDELSNGVNLLGLPKDLTGFTSKLLNGSPPYRNVEEMGYVATAYFDKLVTRNEGASEFTCMICDVNLFWTAAAAAKLQIPLYVFSAVSAFAVLFGYHLRMEDEEEERTLSWNWPNPCTISSRPYTCIDYRFGAERRRNIVHASGILINTFYELESHAVDSLRSMGKIVLPIGPLQSAVQVSKVSFENDDYVDDESLEWLDKQPANSVVYVNFGTTGFFFFTLQMVHELALGLEASQARFLWILRPPPRLPAEELDQLLPSGFEERVKDRGLVLRGWAPQLKILEHPSTAAFVMQGGWNSVQETIARGVPFIAWTTFADQPVNIKYMADVAKVGIQLVKGLPTGTKVDRHDVEREIRRMLSSEEGKLIKDRVLEMKVAAARANRPGGSSKQSFLDFISIIR